MGLRDFLPKISFEEMDFTSQIRIAMLLPILPLLLSETLFFYLIIFAGWNVERSFSVSVVFFSVGIIMYFMFRDRARRSIVNYEPVTAIHSWSKNIAYFENLLIKNRIPLHEHEIVKPVPYKADRPLFENHPMVEEVILEKTNGKIIRKVVKRPIRIKPFHMGLHEVILRNPELIDNIICGKFYSETALARPSDAPNGIPYRRAQYIHFFPEQDDFYQVPDQLIVHNAQVLTGKGAVIYAHFLYWGERLEPIPVFLVTSSPQWTEVFQQAIGIKPILDFNGDLESNRSNLDTLGTEIRQDIKSTLTLGDTVEAMTYAQLLEGQTKKLEGLLDHNYTVEDQAIGLMGTWNRNREIMREERKWQWLKNRRIWIAVGLVVILGLALWWLFY